MLTEEMDNCAEYYRQTDQHPIAAMNSEPYEVPSAYSLPGRMTEYYAFFASWECAFMLMDSHVVFFTGTIKVISFQWWHLEIRARLR